MSTTQTLRTALVTDLEGISGIDTVSRGPLRHDEIGKPGAAITSGPGGASEIESLTNERGLATQEFVVRLFVSSATPNQDMDDLLDDVRDAVESSTSNLVAAAGVEMVAVTEWTEPTTEEGIHGTTYVRDVTVEVRYLYTRGSL